MRKDSIQGFILYKIYYDDCLVYIGRTKQPLQTRIRGHLFKKPMHRSIYISNVSKIEYAEFLSEADMNLYEIYYINLLKPPLNCDDKAKDELTVSLPDVDWNEMCYVSIDKDNNILGYISYSVDRDTGSVHSFGAINFSDNKIVFGLDLCEVIDDIFCKFNLARMEFCVICGNPIEKTYDKMVNKYGGRIIGTRRRVTKLYDGKIYDEKIYEMFREDYLKNKRVRKVSLYEWKMDSCESN